jgi:hypothetical protein
MVVCLCPPRLAALLACAASLVLLLALLPRGAQAVYDAEGAAAGQAETSAQLALEFGEPDPDPDHPDPEDQRVLDDPAGWPWWAWAALLLGFVALGVPVALLLMRKVERARRSERDQEG